MNQASHYIIDIDDDGAPALDQSKHASKIQQLNHEPESSDNTASYCSNQSSAQAARFFGLSSFEK